MAQLDSKAHPLVMIMGSGGGGGWHGRLRKEVYNKELFPSLLPTAPKP